MGIHNNFSFNELKLSSYFRLLWRHPIFKTKSPEVTDEAEYIFSLLFSEDVFEFLLTEKSSYELKLRTWVGGDKDGNPAVDHRVMRACLNGSRTHLVGLLGRKIDLLLKDFQELDSAGVRVTGFGTMRKLRDELSSLARIGPGDGSRVKKWQLKYAKLMRQAPVFLRKHHQAILIQRIFDLFPALVLPIELREDAGSIRLALKEKSAPIRMMLSELRSIAGAMAITSYARGLVISHCETYTDIERACALILAATKSRILPAIPLFESKDAIVSAKQILRLWLRDKKNTELARRHWGGKFEVMLGYSDSAKQIGALPSRLLIYGAMYELESVLKGARLQPVFFHGSGGSVARGGGSIKEQIAWWSDQAVKRPKLTIQGEMIQRLFSSKEILHSQCAHLANEALKRRRHKKRVQKSAELQDFAARVERHYRQLTENGQLLGKLLEATPYRYLDQLKFGSRPVSRPRAEVSVSALRAIPWNLCWTQSRLLLPSWWGIGSAWKASSPEEKAALKQQFQENDFFISFVKTLGFTMAKVELDVWELYFPRREPGLFHKVRQEYLDTVSFVNELSGTEQLIWHRPWLEESIRLRSPHIHILNLLQILAMEERDEPLLRETVVGVACGMLTTG